MDVISLKVIDFKTFKTNTNIRSKYCKLDPKDEYHMTRMENIP